ncbi:hypothetical protein [Vibrio cholerae]|uniref:hypothetical protein n=1 Tax=Vibrio cholerae TaxID=666 RepID=UPI00158231DB|nr:hypothetical protein [Vibrio cholerae]QKU57448.1 hypothetical protein HPY04_15380 [Vibrio cholerae]
MRKNVMQNLITWRNDQSSFNQVRKQLNSFKKELQNVKASNTFKELGDSVKKNSKTFDTAKAKSIAFRKEQALLDRSLSLTEAQSTSLKNKLANLNKQFVNNKMDLATYNYEVARTAKYYSNLSTEARRAQRETERLAKQQAKQKASSKKGGGVGAGLKGGALGLAATAATGIMGVFSGQQATQELSNAFAKAVNTSFTDFQNFAASNAQYGIGVDKSGDILKDLSDRLGEYLLEGKGEGAPLFDLIKQQTGMSNKDLQNMGSVDLLRTINQTLEKSGKSEQERVFLLESLADDSSLLLKSMNNLDRMAKLRERFGLNTSAERQQQLTYAQMNTSLMGEGLSKLSESLFAGFGSMSPEQMNKLLNLLKDLQPTFIKAGELLAEGFSKLVTLFSTATIVVEKLVNLDLAGALNAAWTGFKDVFPILQTLENKIFGVFMSFSNGLDKVISKIKSAFGLDGSPSVPNGNITPYNMRDMNPVPSYSGYGTHSRYAPSSQSGYGQQQNVKVSIDLKSDLLEAKIDNQIGQSYENISTVYGY